VIWRSNTFDILLRFLHTPTGQQQVVMGEMSDYFEDFPEENPANFDERGQFNPSHREEAERLRIANEKLDEALRHPDKNPEARQLLQGEND
jgi:hypothetical protein